MTWSPNGEWLVSADNVGMIKYWQSNMNNVKAFRGHTSDPIRDLSYFIFFHTAQALVILTIAHVKVCADQQQVCLLLGRRSDQDLGFQSDDGGHRFAGTRCRGADGRVAQEQGPDCLWSARQHRQAVGSARGEVAAESVLAQEHCYRGSLECQRQLVGHCWP